jgi:hypothetical protein
MTGECFNLGLCYQNKTKVAGKTPLFLTNTLKGCLKIPRVVSLPSKKQMWRAFAQVFIRFKGDLATVELLLQTLRKYQSPPVSFFHLLFKVLIPNSDFTGMLREMKE